MGNMFTTFVTGAVALMLLPDAVAMQSEAVWETRESLRQSVRSTFGPLLSALFTGSFAQLAMACVRRCVCGRLASPCRAPHSLKAQAIGSTELVLWWTPSQPKGNPFHEESYVCAWRPAPPVPERDAGEGGATPAEAAAAEEWHEALVQDDFETTDAQRQATDGCRAVQRTALLPGFPARATLRLRIAAVNRHGRSDWSKEEIEVDLPAQERITKAMAAKGVGKSRLVTSGAHLCVRCRAPQMARKDAVYADVLCRPSVGARDCEHGPFCPRCRRRVSEQVLPSCVCRALIGTWREPAAAAAPSS